MKSIAIIGKGYVGSAMAEFFSNRFNIVSYDITYDDIYPQDEIDAADAVIICVSTPMSEDGSCNIENVDAAISRINNENIMIKSTVAPGTTEWLSKRYDKDICFSPEYIGESTYRNTIYKTVQDVPFVIVGGAPEKVRYFFELFETVLGPEATYYECSSLDAELIKYMKNSYLATKVTFVNEFYDIAQRFGANWHRIREGWLLDERIGRPFTTVFADKRGYSGKCLPKDVNAIVAASTNEGYAPTLLQQVIKTNDLMLDKNR